MTCLDMEGNGDDNDNENYDEDDDDDGLNGFAYLSFDCLFVYTLGSQET